MNGSTTVVRVRRPLPYLLLAATAAVAILGFSLKLSCTRVWEVGCYSDLGVFWQARDVVAHRFPYLAGGLDANGNPVGGTYEYPVLTGILIWLTSLPATDVRTFLQVNAVVNLVLALGIAAILWREAGRRAWWWALSPALALYPLLNWDLPAVICAVAGFAAMRLGPWERRTRAVVAAVLFGLGFAFKIYPGFFMAPLVLHLLLDADPAEPRSAGVRDRVTTALVSAAAWLGVVVLVNLPFAVFGREGWWASIQFQRQRRADVTTNSLWYWGVRPAYGDNPAYDALVDRWSPALVLAAFALVLWLGWRLTRGRAAYPWVQVSAAMLTCFFVFHKVDSPQYALWLMPFFVLLRVPWQAVVAYVAANVGIGIGYFLYVSARPRGTGILMLGVWGSVLTLTVLTVLFLLAHEVHRPVRRDRFEATQA